MQRGDELLISCHRLCPGQDRCWAALTAKGTLDFGSVAGELGPVAGTAAVLAAWLMLALHPAPGRMCGQRLGRFNWLWAADPLGKQLGEPELEGPFPKTPLRLVELCTRINSRHLLCIMSAHVPLQQPVGRCDHWK